MELNVSSDAGKLIDFGRDIIDKIWPDKTAQAAERAAAEAHVLDLAQARYQSALQASVASDAAQADINKIEAASPRFWNSGWRPAIGWVGATALFVYYVPYCIAATGMWVYQCYVTHSLVHRPDLDVSDLIALIVILLGGSTQRMIEKLKGVAS
jgi:hypothetical protein